MEDMKVTYRITRTLFHKRDGSKEFSDKVVDVDDLEEYRASIRRSDDERINFVYQTIESGV